MCVQFHLASRFDETALVSYARWTVKWLSEDACLRLESAMYGSRTCSETRQSFLQTRSNAMLVTGLLSMVALLLAGELRGRPITAQLRRAMVPAAGEG